MMDTILLFVEKKPVNQNLSYVVVLLTIVFFNNIIFKISYFFACGQKDDLIEARLGVERWQ